MPLCGARLVVAGATPVLLGQEIHREMDAVEAASLHIEVTRPFRAARQHQRIAVAQQRIHPQRDTDLDAGAECDTFRRHLLDAAIDQMLLHLEIGNAVAQQATDAIVLLK